MSCSQHVLLPVCAPRHRPPPHQYFGVLFLGTGGVIISRVLFSDQPKPRLLLAFAGLVFVSGFLCFVLQQRFITSLRCARAKKIEIGAGRGPILSSNH